MSLVLDDPLVPGGVARKPMEAWEITAPEVEETPVSRVYPPTGFVGDNTDGNVRRRDGDYAVVNDARRSVHISHKGLHVILLRQETEGRILDQEHEIRRCGSTSDQCANRGENRRPEAIG
jgi:hypothetical protein